MRALRTALALGFAGVLTGCYTLQPVRESGVRPGDELAFELNDAGRAGLGLTIGPEIEKVQGSLLRSENSEYVVAVMETRSIRGATQVWNGEQVRIKPEYVRSVSERQYSKARTYALSAAGIVGFAIFVNRSVIGGGTIPDESPIPPNGNALRRP